MTAWDGKGMGKEMLRHTANSFPISTGHAY